MYAEIKVTMLEINKIQFSFMSKCTREYKDHSEQHKHVSKGKIKMFLSYVHCPSSLTAVKFVTLWCVNRLCQVIKTFGKPLQIKEKKIAQCLLKTKQGHMEASKSCLVAQV